MALARYMKLAIEFTDFNPLLQASTLPSFAHFVCRFDHMDESEKMAIIPETGYGKDDNQSELNTFHLTFFSKYLGM